MTAPDVNADVRARPMGTAPRDGTMLRLLVRFEEHSTEDAEEAWTIGANSCDANGEDVWQFAGWCWTHDHFTDGKGTPIGWLPMHEPHADLSGEVRELVEALRLALATIDDYIAYEHDGDPWKEDARAMGEMDINDFASDGRLERCKAALAKLTQQEKP